MKIKITKYKVICQDADGIGFREKMISANAHGANPRISICQRKERKMGHCVKCKERWTGLSRAHCTGCHRTFNSVGAFDRHRVGFKCLDPVDLGMKMDEKGIWARPMPKSAILARIGR